MTIVDVYVILCYKDEDLFNLKTELYGYFIAFLRCFKFYKFGNYNNNNTIIESEKLTGSVTITDFWGPYSGHGTALLVQVHRQCFYLGPKQAA